MKKILALVLALALVVCASLALAEEEATPVAPMTKEEYDLAELDAPVCVEAYVQDAQDWWENAGVGQMTLYLQNEEGAFFAYNVQMDKETSELLVPGTKVRVTGYKTAWAGEVEIVDGAVEILEAEPWIAEAEDITALLAAEDLAAHMNEKVAIKGAKVVAYDPQDASVSLGGDLAFAYNWDNSGSHDANSDLYFTVEVDGAAYKLTVESYLRGSDTEVYQAVEALQIGDVIDIEAFLYWYNTANPHVVGVTVVK